MSKGLRGAYVQSWTTTAACNPLISLKETRNPGEILSVFWIVEASEDVEDLKPAKEMCEKDLRCSHLIQRSSVLKKVRKARKIHQFSLTSPIFCSWNNNYHHVILLQTCFLWFWCQLPEQFRAHPKLMQEVKGIVQMPLKHWQAWDIKYISRNAVLVSW